MFKKHIIVQILYIIVGPLCPASLKCIVFYKAPPSDKRSLLWLANCFKFQVLFVTYTTIQRLYNQQWNVSRVRSMDSANIVEYNTREVCIK